MSWLYLAAGSVIFFTSMNLVQRMLATEAKNPRALTLLFNGFAVIVTLVIYILTGGYKTFSLPANPQVWIGIFIALLCYGLFERYRFNAAKLLDASVNSTVSNISVFVAIFGAVYLYSEPLTLNKILGSVLILTSLLMVTYNKKLKSSSLKGILIGLAINTLLGIGWMLDKHGTKYINAETYNILVWLIPIIFIYFPGIDKKDLKSEFKTANWRIILMSVLNVSGYFLQLKALETGEATRVIPIVQTSTLFTVLLGIILLKERENLLNKLIAGILAVTGAFLLI